MKKIFLLLLLSLIFINGCNLNKENAFDGKLIKISLLDPSELEPYVGSVEKPDIGTLEENDFYKIGILPPNGFSSAVDAKYYFNNSYIEINIARFYDEKNASDNMDIWFNLNFKGLENKGHKLNISNKFDFINNSVDSVKAFYHKGWIYDWDSNLNVASSIYIKKGVYITRIDENLNHNTKSIGQENLEKIAELVLKQNNFSQ